uniref:Dynein assembly factor 3, axonemal n=1 Tax=Cacopsylla melanoneura TaxID=428564 RepID=A0A8D8YTG2_9HEMI
MWWGYTPAIDLQDYLIETKGEEIPVLNILVIYGADARHILQTLAKKYKHPTRKIHFYVIEPLVDFLAKQMLLLTAALEPPQALGLQEKVRLFMEIYGNLLVRPPTVNYIIQKSRQLIHMVTDESFLDFRLPLVKLNMMKFKEIDALQNTFQFWFNNTLFNVVHMWDIRLRRSLGVRYDHRDGAFDWDYQMQLKSKPGGERVNYQEYKHWRETGVAFTWLETENTEPNLTFATGVLAKGEKLVSQGYLGDITNGPFLGFGIDCEDKDLLKTANGICVKRSADIMERNLLRLFYELEQGKEYEHCAGGVDDELGVVIRDISKVDVNKVGDVVSPREKPRDITKKKETYSALYIPKAQVHFLPCTSLHQFPQSSKFKNFFNMVYMSSTAVKMIGTHLNQLIEDNASVLIESKKYIVGIGKDEMSKFVDSVNELAKQNGWQPCKPFDVNTDSLAWFRKTKTTEEI